MDYIFIDGGYFDRHLDSLAETFCDKAPIDIDYEQFFRKFSKKFYYHADPPRKSGEDDAAYKVRLAAFDERMEQLQKIPGFHVYFGKTVREGKRAQQKGVDVQLAVHMLSHGIKRNAKSFTLLAGDYDFKPLVDELVREGVYVEVMAGRRSASVDLLNAADEQKPITFYSLQGSMLPSFREKYGFGVSGRSDEANPEWPIVLRGETTDRSFNIRVGDIIQLTFSNPRHSINDQPAFMHVRARTLELAKEFPQDYLGCTIEWRVQPSE